MSEAQLKLLRQKRGQVKRSVTVLEKWLDNLPADFKLKSIIDGELKIEDLKQHKLAFKELHDDITECYVALEKDDANMEEHEGEFEHFEERCFNGMTKLNELVEEAKRSLSVPQVIEQSNGFARQSVSLKLPEMQLPTFDGQLVNYQSFKETFKALVHNDVRLSAIQKFFYLKNCLKNTSISSEISSLELTEENYNLAWDLIISRYENKKALVNKHIRFLFGLPRVERNSASSLRELIDNVSKHVHGLKSQHVIIPDAILIYLVTSKLDEASLQLWEAHDATVNVDDVATFDCLRLFATNRARALENVEEFIQRKPHGTASGQYGNSVKLSENLNKRRDFQPRKALAALNKSTIGEQASGIKEPCLMCNKGHPLWKCDGFLNKSVKDRNDFVKEKKLCSRCLRKHGDKCTYPFNCRKCDSANHNSLIHFAN